MLTTTKSITLVGQSNITEEGKTVTAVQLSANISTSGNSNIVSTIVNNSVYEANKTSCRADIDAFTDMVRTIEDEVTE